MALVLSACSSGLAATSSATASTASASNAASTGGAVGTGSSSSSGTSGTSGTTTLGASSGSGVSSSTGGASSGMSSTTSGAVAGDACHPFTMPSSDALFASPRKVFAHYFMAFPLQIGDVPSADDYYNVNYLSPQGEHDKWYDAGGYLRQRPLSVPVTPADGGVSVAVLDMEREVRLAMNAGITGFMVDILGPNQWDAGTPLQNLLQAAKAVEPRFQIVPMIDLAALNGGYQNDAGLEATAAEATLSSVVSWPNAGRLPDGRLIVSSFYAEGQPPSWWTSVFAHVDAGAPIAFVPVFLGWGNFASAYTPVSYGLSDWGTATPEASAGSEPWPGMAHDAGEIFMLPLLSQQYRPKDFSFWEAQGSQSLQAGWAAAIDGGADWVQIVTWSDFSESGEIEPYTDATLAGDIGTGYYDLTGYYSSWYLTGQPPPITRDALYYFYRRESTTAPAPAQQQATVPAAGGGTGMNIIELVGLLTSPGMLTITIGGQTHSFDAPAGISSFTVPLAPGVPSFALTRDGGPLISFSGGVTVVEGGLDSGVLDLTYWTGSADSNGVCLVQIQ